MSNTNVVQIERPAHLEVNARCPSCNAPGHVGCGCGVPYEKVLAKREATRQRVARHREKANENNDGVTRYTDVENIEESPKEVVYGGTESAAFILRADTAARMAAYSGRASRQVYEAARYAADEWTKLANDLERRIK